MEALGARERKLLIVIDALDELPHDGTQDRVLRLLADAFSTLPEWVKLFTTSREEAAIKVKLAKFKPTELRVEDEKNLRDVKAYLAHVALEYVSLDITTEDLERAVKEAFPDVNIKGKLKELEGPMMESKRIYKETLDGISARDEKGALKKLLAIPEARPANLKQMTTNFDALYEEASTAQDILAETFDGKEWAGSVINPGIKGRPRALEKLKYDYNNDATQLKDLARMTLAFGAPHDLVGAFEAMKSSGDVDVAQVKNKFANPTPLGYRDMNTCVCVDLGADEGGKKHIAEVQLNLSEMLTAKKRAHVHYEKIRTVIGDACKELSDDVGEKLQEFIVSKLSSSALDAAVAKLVGKAGGLMVYAKLLHDQLKLEKETTGAVDFGKLATLPQGLDEMYQANFGRVFGDVVKKGWRDAKPIVAMIIAAGEPPPASLLRLVLAGDAFTSILETKMSILFPMRSDGLVHVMHKSVVDWLKKPGHAFSIEEEDVQSAHETLGRTCAKIIDGLFRADESRLKVVCDGEPLSDVVAERYAIKHCVTHMCAGGHAADARALLMNFSWMLMRARLGPWMGIVEDARRVLGKVGSDDRAMELLASALGLAQQALAKENGWEQLAGQLVGRLLGYAEKGELHVGEVKSLLESVYKWRGRNWWCPTSRTMIPAGSPCTAVLTGHGGWCYFCLDE